MQNSLISGTRDLYNTRLRAGYYKGPVLCDTVCTQNWFGVNIPNWRNFMESKERKWLGDVKARCFLISSITCYAVQEREREREREKKREWRKEVNMLLGHSHQRPNFFQQTRPIHYVWWSEKLAALQVCTELCNNIPAKFRESPSKCSAAHPKNALRRNISASHS